MFQENTLGQNLMHLRQNIIYRGKIGNESNHDFKEGHDVHVVPITPTGVTLVTLEV